MLSKVSVADVILNANISNWLHGDNLESLHAYLQCTSGRKRRECIFLDSMPTNKATEEPSYQQLVQGIHGLNVHILFHTKSQAYCLSSFVIFSPFGTTFDHSLNHVRGHAHFQSIDARNILASPSKTQ